MMGNALATFLQSALPQLKNYSFFPIRPIISNSVNKCVPVPVIPAIMTIPSHPYHYIFFHQTQLSARLLDKINKVNRCIWLTNEGLLHTGVFS